jgi:hypothetical protein
MKVEIANLEHPENSRTFEFLLNSDAILSIVAGAVLVELGIRPYAEDSRGRRKGVALFRFGEHVGVGDVIFGEHGDAPLLGSLVLGSLGFELDPRTRELLPLPMILT